MNTTMAPMDQLRQHALEEPRRRHDYIDESSLRRRAGGDDGPSQGGKRGSGGDGNNDGNGNGKGNGDLNDDGGKDDNNNSKNGGGQKHQSPPAAQQFESPTPLPPLPSPSLFLTSPSATPTPTTIVLVSTTTAPAILATSSSNTFISTFFPITSTPSFSVPPESTPQPRHGVSDPPDEPSKSEKTTVTQTTTSSLWLIPESAVASPTPTASAQDKDNQHHAKAKHDTGNLTPLAQHLLIAAGAIGAFVVVVAGIYFLTRMRKIDLLASLRNRKFGRGGARGWYGWRKEETYYMDPPPKYSGDIYPSEKNIPAQQQGEAFYTPTAIPPMATPASAANALARSDSGRQEMVREALLDNPAPFATSPATQPVALSATANFYGIAAQSTSLSRQPGTQNSQNTFVSQLDPSTGTQNTFLTMNTMRSMQTQDAYDPNQREPNHLSYLSSLSSGFGDGLIIPEPTVVGGGRQSYRQSKAPGAGRFSWMTSNRGSRAPGYGDRDTVYTTTSVDSAPRFRSVNSWVAQQAGRVEREQEIPAMPAIPGPLQAGVAPVVDHQRKISEDPAFRQHPGDEIELKLGTRVPSAILDRKTGVN